MTSLRLCGQRPLHDFIKAKIMTEVISYAREKRPKALTPLYIVYVVPYTFNVYDQVGNMYTYNVYVVSCTFGLLPPSVAPCWVRASCTYYVFMRAWFFGKSCLIIIQCISSHARYPTCTLRAPMRRSYAVKLVNYYTYILYVNSLREEAPRIPFFVMRCAHTTNYDTLRTMVGG